MPQAPWGLLDVLGLGRLRRARSGAPREWRTTTGTVLSSSVQVGVGDAGAARAEQPLVFYSYQVEGQVFQGRRIRFNDQPIQASAVVDRCTAGSAVIVFYDPTDPSNSTLQL
ncbi:MAG: DUF3592 domain-containing protein [Ilumatobacteraceae bacterium]